MARKQVGASFLALILITAGPLQVALAASNTTSTQTTSVPTTSATTSQTSSTSSTQASATTTAATTTAFLGSSTTLSAVTSNPVAFALLDMNGDKNVTITEVVTTLGVMYGGVTGKYGLASKYNVDGSSGYTPTDLLGVINEVNRVASGNTQLQQELLIFDSMHGGDYSATKSEMEAAIAKMYTVVNSNGYVLAFDNDRDGKVTSGDILRAINFYNAQEGTFDGLEALNTVLANKSRNTPGRNPTAYSFDVTISSDVICVTASSANASYVYVYSTALDTKGLPVLLGSSWYSWKITGVIIAPRDKNNKVLVALSFSNGSKVTNSYKI
jgi:hypothetical protein